MKINRKIQILIILTIIAIALAAIGISANNIVNEKTQSQQNVWCPYTEECPQQYCDNQKQSNWNNEQNTWCPYTDDCPKPYCDNLEQSQNWNNQPRSSCCKKT